MSKRSNSGRLRVRLRQKLVILSLLMAVCQYSHALVVLQYHHISEDTPAATSISPERFAEHMAWLADNQYEVMSMPDLVAHLRQKKELPDKTVVITFDDGYNSIYTTAWPILRARKWPFTIFINSQHHDEKNQQYMSWKQLRELAQAGATIGNHSVSHGHMIRVLPGEKDKDWQKRMAREIDMAQQRIDSELGPQKKVFAYPFGEHNDRLEKLLSKRQYIAFAQHSGPIAAFDSHQALPRFPFGGHYGEIKDFAQKASSLPMPLTSVQLASEEGQPLTGPLLPGGVTRATMILEAEPTFLQKISCFYSGKPVETEVRDGKLYVSTEGKIPAGRSRFNCTAPEKGRFYWFSKMLIKKNADGNWYKE